MATTGRESTSSVEDEVMHCPAKYILLRKAGPFEVLTHEFHELGIQTNILVSAKYCHSDSDFLTSSMVFKALTKVISEHPALSIIVVSQPSGKKEGNHRLWEARIPVVDLSDCVRFVNDSHGNDFALARIFETAHNQKFDTQDKTKPWWRLVVVNNSHVVFVYHHSIGDGLSGYAFHRSLLAALNSIEPVSNPTAGHAETSLIVESPKSLPPPCPVYEIQDKLSWPYVIYNFLFWNIVRFLINQKHFLFSDAIYSKTSPTVAKPFSTEERTITKVQILRISKGAMARCLASCRDNKTSFTALLHTIILVTLASDIYPNAKLGFSRLAVNIRPQLKTDPGLDIFTNAASDHCRVQFLGKCRTAGTDPKNPAPEDENPSQRPHVKKDLVWKLARDYKAGLNDFIWKSRNVLQDFLTGQLLGKDEEDFGTFYGMGVYQNNSFLISNIGVFEPKQGIEDGGWFIEDMAFSAGTIRAALGIIGIIFNVASAQDGDCVICATYEDRVLKDDMVRKVLDITLARLEMVI